MSKYKNLTNIRKSKKVKIDEILSLLKLETRAAYYKKEQGKIRFSLDEAKLIADYFKLSIEELFFKNINLF